MQKVPDTGNVTKKSWFLPLLSLDLALAIFIIDALTKRFIFGMVTPASADDAFPIFRLIVHKNYGITFNLPLPLWLIIVTTVILVFLALAAWNVAARENKRCEALALAILIGGAFGNFFDRLVFGFARDWLLILNRSAINFADVAIIIGLVWYLWEKEKKQVKSTICGS